ncbi:MAG: hypothetical protein K6U00_06065, partial [Armatimonadetes bacterium]|nr:hypothetical protein [Armatimonadota bacterium]
MIKVLIAATVLFVLSVVGSVQADIPITLVGRWGGPCNAVAVSGNYAYAGVGPRLVVLDITNPSNPTEVGRSDVLPDNVLDVTVSGGYAYVADGYAGLQVIDISNPAGPVRVGGYDTSGYARGVAISGSYAYVADGSGGLVILHVDTTSPGSLRVDIQPAEAVAAGAQWRRVGTATWLNSGEVEENIAPGIYTVEFKPVSGWIKPADMQVRVWPASLATATGVYVDASLEYITIGTGTSTWEYPLATYYHDARTQIIYLASELGSTAWQIKGLALDVTRVPGQTMNNFTIPKRVMTDLSSYPS